MATPLTRSKKTGSPRPRRRVRLAIAVTTMALLSVVRLRAEAGGEAPAAPRGEPPGSDVFVMVREALLRDKPSKESRFVGKLPGGSRLKLVEAGEPYLKVEVVSGTLPGDPAPDGLRRKGAAAGYLSREVASIFPPGSGGTGDLVAAGRALAGSEGHRRLAAAFLLCASERLRAEGPGEPALELLLGETAEALANAGGPFPPGLEVSLRNSAAASAATRWTYTGNAFVRAASMTEKSEDPDLVILRQRALAGRLRQQYPEPSASLTGLWSETAAWLELAESATDGAVLRGAAERLGASSLSLGRLLLAAGRLEDLDKVEKRVRAAGGRARTVLAGDPAGARLLSRAQILRAMRGNGASAFPQETQARLGPKEIVVRIQGKLGALELVAETLVGGTHIGPVKKSAIPVLPLPGSLRISPDGKSAAWIEVAGPSKLVPVVASLDRDEPAREVAFLSTGRPLRDSALAHVVSSLSGYSKDGQRLGVAIQAWNDTPGPEARYSVVSVATGALLFETSKDIKGFQRLLQ